MHASAHHRRAASVERRDASSASSSRLAAASVGLMPAGPNVCRVARSCWRPTRFSPSRHESAVQVPRGGRLTFAWHT
eukprot:scaffold117159_cov75-Phaeocystis_antarctica.AAC.4